jgi:site-specific DNA-methyltransferase (adenine-specific)
MDINQLKTLSKKKLQLICSNLDIKKYKSKNKDHLIEIIMNHSNNNECKDIINNECKDIVNNEKKFDKSEINVDIANTDGLMYLKTIENNSIDLILTDPPYIISKETGMNTLYNNIQENMINNILEVKTDEEWEKYKDEKNIKDDSNKKKYKKYGSIYGNKYGVKTDYGDWDKLFTMDILDEYISEYYKKLRKGGTLIIFFDLWKISYLKKIMENYKFKQIRFIEWIKTNPQPLNSKTNYLTNSREIALLCVKSGKPTFNSKYDNGIYNYPIQGGKERFHPTQKNLKLIEDLIIKHSNENDIVLDTFLGSGTTAIACLNTNRQFKGCELDETYYNKIMVRYNNKISK